MTLTASIPSHVVSTLGTRNHHPDSFPCVVYSTGWPYLLSSPFPFNLEPLTEPEFRPIDRKDVDDGPSSELL
jgi:hypothetical protein